METNVGRDIKGKFTKGNTLNRSAKRYEVDPETGCWNWTLCLNKAGYSWENWLGKARPAYVRFYEEKYGTVPKGLQLDHLCRNKKCVNPDHLEAVTCLINNQRKSSLTPELVREIRSLREKGLTYRGIASLLNVGKGAVDSVIRGKSWTNIQ